MEKVKISEVCNISNGFAFKSEKYVNDNGGRVIRITNVQKGKIVDNDPKLYPFSELDKLEAYKIFEGDILMSLTGNVGRVGRFPKELLPAYINQRVCRVMPKNEKLDTNFLFHFLNSDVFENDAVRNSAGAAQLNLSTNWLAEYEIPLPNLATQQRIAAILDQAEAIILNNRAIVKKYDALTQSLFLDMFGDPVKNEKGWEKKEFSKVAINENSKRIPVKQSDRDEREGEYPYYGATGIIDTIDDYKFDGEYLLIAEDGKNLLFRKKNNAFMAYGKFWVNNHAHILSCNNICNLKYLEFFLNSIDLSPFISGIDQIKLNKASLDRIPVIVPPIELQNQFAERVAMIEAQKQQAQLELAKSEELFNSLLQRAFNGELS